jgi:predicted alpha/beta-fold hydrolase
VIQSQDDPLVPFAPLRRAEVSASPSVVAATPLHGGHVAFVSAEKGERFWAEERLADFCRRLSDDPSP